MTPTECALAFAMASEGWCPTPPSYLPRRWECADCDAVGCPSSDYPCRRCGGHDARWYLDISQPAVHGWLASLLWGRFAEGIDLELRYAERRCTVCVGASVESAPTMGEALALTVQVLWKPKEPA